MKENFKYRFAAEQWLPIDPVQAWTFFSSPLNLTRITPPWLNLVILTPGLEGKIHEGMVIDYTVQPIAGISLPWTTAITHVEEGKSFTDRQIKGPYTCWEHTHTFQPMDNSVLMNDEIVYQLPFGLIGQAIHQLLIRKKIESIFNYRRNTLQKIFTI